ncbi:hypothetical protein L602_002300000860 [Cupriavidus gilardii J11]|uniref:Uncharacterized protein n=1 Tax=Cupriavidus gilardii J11 TaxID=936133 RepID=A0A562BKX2_9BURK|nr:hypothetical protein L602_002300000860 [Cupriavidus gilardii J11]
MPGLPRTVFDTGAAGSYSCPHEHRQHPTQRPYVASRKGATRLTVDSVCSGHQATGNPRGFFVCLPFRPAWVPPPPAGPAEVIRSTPTPGVRHGIC